MLEDARVVCSPILFVILSTVSTLGRFSLELPPKKEPPFYINCFGKFIAIMDFGFASSRCFNFHLIVKILRILETNKIPHAEPLRKSELSNCDELDNYSGFFKFLY
uniref:Uncharacterized protein n=1 Tax=Romanomermis culicivorax TaxID=13658 RepID=A0A915I3U6_ROMCU